jgi:hypothetical protein
VASFLPAFPPKPCTLLPSPLRATFPAHLSLSLIWPEWRHLGMSTSYEAPHCEQDRRIYCSLFQLTLVSKPCAWLWAYREHLHCSSECVTTAGAALIATLRGREASEIFNRQKASKLVTRDTSWRQNRRHQKIWNPHGDLWNWKRQYNGIHVLRQAVNTVFIIIW